MNLPGTVAGLLGLLLGVLPGIPGETLYRWIAGASWREKEYKHVLRILSFSLLGLVTYSLVAGRLGWQQPVHVIPVTFTSPDFTGAQLPALGMAYLGHSGASILVGAAAAGLTKLVGLVAPVAHYRDAWDEFVNFSVPKHWVLVTLNSGETYAGMLEHADVAVEPEYRDIVLAEPYRYDSEMGRFLPTMNQYLFLHGADVGSIAAVYDADYDAQRRVSPVEADPFTSGSKDDRQDEAQSSAAKAG